MGKDRFWEQYKDPRWQRKRLEILKRSNFACSICGETKSELHIHHKYYLKDKAPWEYSDHSLLCLCSSCHQVVHENKARIFSAIFDNSLPLPLLAVTASFLGSIFYGNDELQNRMLEIIVSLKDKLNTSDEQIFEVTNESITSIDFENINKFFAEAFIKALPQVEQYFQEAMDDYVDGIKSCSMQANKQSKKKKSNGKKVH